jgi:fucose permease
MSGFSPVTAVTISGAFAFGTVLSLLGSIKLPLAKRLQIDEAHAGGLLSALNLALIPMMLLSGLLIDRWGVKSVLMLGSLVTALALFSLAVGQTYRWALVAVLLVGVGGAGLSTGSVVLMPQAFFPDQAAASLNLGNVFFGLGALITPALADLLLHTVRFRSTLGLLALLCLVPAGVALFVPGSQLPVPAPQGDLASVLRSPLLWLSGLVFFLYGPLEFAIGTWATTYLTDHHYRPTRAAWLLSGFWLTFFAARLGMAFLEGGDVLPRESEAWVILFLALLSAVALGNLAGASTKGNAGLGLLVLGAFLGPIFPTLMGGVFEAFPDHRGTAYGAVFTLGSVGSLLLAPFIGRRAQATSVQQSLGILMLLALALTFAALVLGLAASQFAPTQGP